ncbi:MAG: tetratricopeptide repeat protein [Candidatus Longimicrobiales bacterium M2_2A_002]
MIRAKGLILAMTVAFATACASGGTGGGEMPAAETGNRPTDNSYTGSAGVHLVQAGLAEGQEAEQHYRAALQDAMTGIQTDSTNPKSYLQAGQAAIGLQQWVRADSMLDRALELYPPYEERIVAEREQAWVDAYNTGAEALNQGNLEKALTYLEGADTIYQGRPEARMALGSLYMGRGDTEAAAEAYRDALEILSGPPPEGMNEEQVAGWARDRQVAAFNAAQLLAESGDYEDAISVLQGFLEENEGRLEPSTELRAKTALAGFMASAGQTAEAEALFAEISTREDLTSADHFQVGIGYFNTGDYAQAAEAFKQAAELNPYSRDALLNLVQSLYSQALDVEELEPGAERDEQLVEIYDELLAAAEQVRTLDPLNRNLLSFMLRSLQAKAEMADQSEARQLAQRTQELVRTYQEQSYEVSQISVRTNAQNQAVVTGVLTNLTGTAGDEVQLRFSLMDQEGNTLDSATIFVQAPEQNASTEFQTTLDTVNGEFAGWKYEVVN